MVFKIIPICHSYTMATILANLKINQILKFVAKLPKTYDWSGKIMKKV